MTRHAATGEPMLGYVEHFRRHRATLGLDAELVAQVLAEVA